MRLNHALLAILILCIAGAEPRFAMNDHILEFCRNHLGEKVGEGQCSHLAESAIASVGAKSHWKMDRRGDDNYVWGKLVCSVDGEKHGLKGVVPGDIIQMRDSKFVGQGGEFITLHHTAIVKEVSGSDVIVYEQGAEQPNTERTYHIADLQSGWMRFYRPIR